MIGDSWSPISESRNSISTGFDLVNWLFWRYLEPVWVVTSRVILPDRMACLSAQEALAGKFCILSISNCK